MTPLPAEFVETLRRERGDADARALCAALDTASPVCVRLNPAKDSAALFGGDTAPVPWSSNGLYLSTRPQFTLDAAFHAGAYYVQEAGSQAVEYMLRGVPVGGARILDMCAAPGGKTTLYSTLAGRDGLVVANEYVRGRANVLADNVRKWGMGNVVVTNNAPEDVARLEGWFDVVAVDAPCSGEGMFRKDEGARSEWSVNNVAVCAARQMAILREAWKALRAGGVLLYSTCTFNTVEDEGVLRRFAEEFADELESAGMDEMPGEWGVECGSVEPFRTLRFMPHKVAAEGFFAAVARKRENVPAGGRIKPQRKPMRDASAAERAELQRWVAGEHRFAAVGDSLYGYPASRYEDVRTVAGVLTAIYSGVEMGRIFKGALKPEWPLALYAALDRGALHCAELDAEEALDYLRKKDGAGVERMAEGMNLVTCGGRALGFAKRIGTRYNNMYPNSLRIMNL